MELDEGYMLDGGWKLLPWTDVEASLLRSVRVVAGGRNLPC